MTETITVNGKKYQLVEEEIVPSEWEVFGDDSRYINSDSQIEKITLSVSDVSILNKNVLPTKELAEAMLALCQLLQLLYETWKRDDNREYKLDNQEKYCIHNVGGTIIGASCYRENKILVFRTEEIRDKFLEIHRELIEQAKALI